MPGRAADLVQIPRSLWDRDVVGEALRNRDIGRLFQLLSQYAGISQTRLAIACSMTQPKISRIMRGTTRVETLEVFERIADGLGMPDSARLALGLAPKARPARSDSAVARPADPRGGDRSPEPMHDSRRDTPFRFVRANDALSEMRDADAAAMRAFRSADLQVGGGHVYASVVKYLHGDVGPRLFGGAESSESPADFTGAAALTEMAGWMAHDAGRDAAAKQHFSRSLALAHVGGDPQLGAHVLGSMSHLASHLSQPEEAIALARQGRAVLQNVARSPGLEARLFALEARGSARRGERAACSKLLVRAAAALGRPAAESPSPWVSQFDQGSLAGEAAWCMRALGDWPETQRQAEAVVRHRPPGRARSRAFGQLTLAVALVAQGRPDEACPIAQEVVEATRSLGSFLVIEQLLRLQQALAPYSPSRAVTEFKVSLNESLRERLWLFQWMTRNARAFAVGDRDSA